MNVYENLKSGERVKLYYCTPRMQLGPHYEEESIRTKKVTRVKIPANKTLADLYRIVFANVNPD